LLEDADAFPAPTALQAGGMLNNVWIKQSSFAERKEQTSHFSI